MEIWVSSLAKVHDTAARIKPDRVVSLLGPESAFPDIEGYGADRHHRVTIDDIRKPMEGYLTPGEAHVTNLISFLEGWRSETPLLVHCWAGISRSSATAFIAACMNNPDAEEKSIAEAIAKASPTAFPNTLIVEHADKILGRGGRMATAATEICEDEERQVNIRMIADTEPFYIPAVF